MKDIYLIHQYYEPTHFKALYDCEENYDYRIKGFIILDKEEIIKRFARTFIKEKKFFISLKNLLIDIKNLFLLRFLRNKTLIVGIAPYDSLMNKYEDIFKRNNSIYFTSWQFWDGNHFPRGKKENKDKFEYALENSFKGAACVSKLTQYYMKKFFQKTSVVNHAINVDKYRKKSKYSKSKKYLFLGSFDERKNVPLLIQWNNENNNFDYEFHFAGGGNLEKDVINLSLKNSKVKFLGRLSKGEIQEQLSEYDFLVLPSKEEPFGIVLLEALAAGVPCIVSNSLGPREIIIDNYNGYIFDLDNISMFKQVMEKSFFISDDEYERLINNALESSKQYDSVNLINNWLTLIE